MTGASYTVRVAPGTDDIFYAASGIPAIAPVNQLALLRDATPMNSLVRLRCFTVP